MVWSKGSPVYPYRGGAARDGQVTAVTIRLQKDVCSGNMVNFRRVRISHWSQPHLSRTRPGSVGMTYAKSGSQICGGCAFMVIHE